MNITKQNLYGIAKKTCAGKNATTDVLASDTYQRLLLSEYFSTEELV